MYPNPFNESVSIVYSLEGNMKNTKLNIYNVYGQVVYSEKITSRDGIINWKGNANTGFYFVQIISENIGTKAQKLVKY